MKAIGYIRVSTTNQDVTRQIAKFREFCTIKNFTNAGEISDFGFSGATFEREGFKKLQSITINDADIIVISELSRLSRKEDILDTLNSVQNITSKGLKLLFLDNPEKIYSGTLDLQEIITLTVSAYGAAQERLMIKRRNQEGKTVLFNNISNAVVDGVIPFGYKKVINPNGNHPKYLLQEDESESKVIRMIFNLVINGYSVGKITRYLFDSGYRNKNGKPFTKQYLSKIYSNPLYKGERLRKDKLIKIEPIVKPEIWDKAQILIKENHLYNSSGSTMFNPLKGIIRCRCGKAMTVKNKGEGILVYRCSESKPAYMKDKKRCSYMDSVRFNLTNEVIFSLLKSTDFIEITVKYEEKVTHLRTLLKNIQNTIIGYNTEISEIKAENSTLEERYISAKVQSLADKIQDLIIKNEDKIKAIEKNILKRNREINQINNQIESLINASKTENFNNLDIKEKAVLFRKYIKKVEFISTSSMLGFYKVEFTFGLVQFIAVNKSPKKPMFSVLPNSFYLDEDNRITVLEGGTETSFNLSDYRNKKIDIKEYFKKYADNYLEVNLDYRSKNRKKEEV